MIHYIADHTVFIEQAIVSLPAYVWCVAHNYTCLLMITASIFCIVVTCSSLELGWRPLFLASPSTLSTTPASLMVKPRNPDEARRKSIKMAYKARGGGEEKGEGKGEERKKEVEKKKRKKRKEKRR